MPIVASASGARGISKVEFYKDADTTPFSTATTAPYQASYPISASAADGSTFLLTAKAYDSTGQTVQASSTVTVVAGDVISSDTTITAADTSHDGHTLILSGATTTVSGAHSFARLVVLSGANLTHIASDGVTQPSVSLTVPGGPVYVACGATIDVTGRGYPSNKSYPGAVLPGDATGGGHLGYGGLSTRPLGSTYGSVYRPQEPGGGAGNGGPGGGIVRITSGTLALDGSDPRQRRTRGRATEPAPAGPCG